MGIYKEGTFMYMICTTDSEEKQLPLLNFFIEETLAIRNQINTAFQSLYIYIITNGEKEGYDALFAWYCKLYRINVLTKLNSLPYNIPKKHKTVPSHLQSLTYVT